MKADHKPDINALLLKIMSKHIGHEKAITSAEIARIIGNYFEDATHFKTRNAITHFLESMEMPIGACPRGYFLISTQAEYEEYIDSLMNRVNGIVKRARLVERAWTEQRTIPEVFYQISLEEYHDKTIGQI